MSVKKKENYGAASVFPPDRARPSHSAPISLVAQTTNTQTALGYLGRARATIPRACHATLTASLLRHFHPHHPGAAFTIASLARQPY